MKYIAIFDIPDDYTIGCAVAKIAPKGKETYSDEDFKNAYADIEPLAEEKAKLYGMFNAVERIIQDMGVSCAYDMPSFWCNKGKDYAVIPTKYHKGYMQAVGDIEKEVRLRFGFAERDDLPVIPFSDIEAEGGDDG